MTAGLLAIIGVVALVIWTIQRPSTKPNRDARALEILAARYTGGEISEEEYEWRRSLLLG